MIPDLGACVATRIRHVGHRPTTRLCTCYSATLSQTSPAIFTRVGRRLSSVRPERKPCDHRVLRVRTEDLCSGQLPAMCSHAASREAQPHGRVDAHDYRSLVGCPTSSTSAFDPPRSSSGHVRRPSGGRSKRGSTPSRQLPFSRSSRIEQVLATMLRRLVIDDFRRRPAGSP